MTNERYKFPKIAHLPWSEGVDTRSDRVWTAQQVQEAFAGNEVVVTEKMDGENTSMYQDYLHARSIDGRHHPSRNWVKQLHGRLARHIPDGWRICGENVYARHSIAYTDLPSYFLVFAIYNERNVCLSWDETLQWANRLGLSCMPELYRGPYNEQAVAACYSGRSVFGESLQEGYVVRLAAEIVWGLHGASMAKFVRRGHVQTDEHWMLGEIFPNRLRQ